MKLNVQIQDPEIGKGWYKAFVDVNPATEDEHILDCVKASHPEATAIRISREYVVRKTLTETVCEPTELSSDPNAKGDAA